MNIPVIYCVHIDLLKKARQSNINYIFFCSFGDCNCLCWSVCASIYRVVFLLYIAFAFGCMYELSIVCERLLDFGNCIAINYFDGLIHEMETNIYI